MTKLGLLQECKDSSNICKSINVIYHIKLKYIKFIQLHHIKMKEKKCDSLNNAEKAFDKIQHTFMIKTLQ